MSIYFSTKAIPELHGYPKAHRRALIERAEAENADNPLLWLGYGLMALGLLTALTATIIFLPTVRTFLPLGMLVGAGIGGLCGALGAPFVVAAIRPTLATYRREQEAQTATLDERHTPLA